MATKRGQLFKPDAPTVALVPSSPTIEPAKAKGRQGKKQIAGWIPVPAFKQFKQIGLDEDKSNEQLLAEALNLLFADRGLPPIA